MSSRLLLASALLASALVAGAAWFALRPPPAPAPEAVPRAGEPDAPAPEPAPPGMEAVGGRVVAEDGAPVAAAEVYLLAPDDPVVPSEAPFRDRTDEDGRFSLARREGSSIDLFAVRPGFLPLRVEGIAAGTANRVVLLRGGEVRGEVVDDAGRPVAGARVSGRTRGARIDPPRGIYLPWRETLGLTFVRTISGLDGAFVLRGVGEGEIDVWAEKRGYPDPGAPVAVEAGGAPLTLVLPRPFTASITVRDADTGRGVAGAAIRVDLLDAEVEPAKGETDWRGECRVSLEFPAARAPETRIRVTVYSASYGGEEVIEGVPLARVEEGNGFSVALTKKAPATLRLKTGYDTGEPFRRWVHLTLESAAGSPVYRWGRVDKEGWATISAPSGTYSSAHVRGAGFTSAVEMGRLVLAPGGTVEETVLFPRGADLSLEVATEDGRPLRGGRVHIAIGDFEADLPLWGKGTHAADLPAGHAEVTVTLRGYEEVRREYELARGARTEDRITLARTGK